MRFRGMVTGPITEDGALKFRLAAIKDDRDGHTYNTHLDRDELNVDNLGVRGKLAWDSDFGLSVTAGLTYSEFTQRSWAIQFNHLNDSDPVTQSYFLFDPDLEDDIENNEGQADEPGYNDRDTITGTVSADWELGDMTLSSVSGYSTYEEDALIDADGGPMPLLTLHSVEDYTQISQELRLAGDFGMGGLGDMRWVGGLYYFYADTSIRTALDLLAFDDTAGSVTGAILPGAVSGLFGPILGAPGLSTVLGALNTPGGVDNARIEFDQESVSYAGFGQIDWELNDALTLIFGVRYTWEKKEVDQSQVLGGTTLIVTQVAEWEDYANVDSRIETGWSPKFSATYHWNDDLMTYITIAKGFKGGGYNASASTDDVLEFEPEEAITYEGGIKAEFLGGGARANIGIFYTEFSNLQVSIFEGTQFIVRNAADAVTRGVEFEFMIMPIEGLMLMTSGAYTDAYFTSFPDAPCRIDQTGPCDLTGERLQRAPEWTGNFSANYFRPIGEMGFGLVLGFDLLYQDDFFLAVDQDPFEEQEAYTQINARFGLRAEDDSWSFMVFGRNLTDEVVMVTAADATLADGSHFAVTEPPRLISAEFTLRY
ncbi:MAG: TonB-dependent receptor [Alphaproteobacteria bacterium]